MTIIQSVVSTGGVGITVVGSVDMGVGSQKIVVCSLIKGVAVVVDFSFLAVVIEPSI